MCDPKLIVLQLQAAGPLRVAELADRLSVEQETVQGTIAGAGPNILRLGNRYALKRSIAHVTMPLDISWISTTGVAHDLCRLTALHGGWHLEWSTASLRPDWAVKLTDNTGFCEGLPFFIADLFPQGFLGRSAAGRLPEAFGQLLDPRDWNDDQTLVYLSELGSDLPGNLMFGNKVLEEANIPHPVSSFSPESREPRYSKLAALADAGEPVGSVVEGEQPKFTTWLEDPTLGHSTAVLVKYSPPLNTPQGQRWADLLAAEAIALNALAEASLAETEPPHPRVFDFDGRRFYEFPRYDRIGPKGRRGVVSLRALHDAGFTGPDTNDWVIAATGLRDSGWIEAADLHAVRQRSLFGRLIGNTDMHFGNLAFYLDHKLPLELAPAYDMLPMFWAPKPDNATPTPTFAPSSPPPSEMDLWSEIAPLAEVFWRRVSSDPNISSEFRDIAEHAGHILRQLRQQNG